MYPIQEVKNIYLNQILELSTSNKYSIWYKNIIEKALSRTEIVEGEKHHIIPRSFKLGGEKDKQNIIKLTYREHFICHLLLARMFLHKGYKAKMINAVLYICSGFLRGTTIRSNPYASKRYSLHRKSIVLMLREKVKEKLWINDGTICKRVKSQELDQYISNGWALGRTFFNRLKVETVNDGFVCKRIPRDEIQIYLSSGWIKGRLQSYKDKITITNGKKNMRVLPDQIPNGFYKGSHLKASFGKIWVNNGAEERYVSKVSSGFVKGRLKQIQSKHVRTGFCITDGTSKKYVYDLKEVPPGWKLPKRSKRRKDPVFQALV